MRRCTEFQSIQQESKFLPLLFLVNAKKMENFLVEEQKVERERVAVLMLKDIMKLKGRSIPGFLKPYQSLDFDVEQKKSTAFNKRQLRHDTD